MMGMLRRARTDLVIEFAGTVYTFLFEKEIDCSKKLFNKKFGSEYINSLKGNIDVLIEEAEKGVLSSQLKLADLLYYNSINYLSDAKEAYSLYQKIAGKKAANKEDQEIIAEACYRLGKFYFVREVNSRSSNIGEVLEDMAKMMGGYRGDPSFYLKKAVRLGHSEAKIALYGAGLYPEFIQEEKARQLEEERLKKEEDKKRYEEAEKQAKIKSFLSDYNVILVHEETDESKFKVFKSMFEDLNVELKVVCSSKFEGVCKLRKYPALLYLNKNNEELKYVFYGVCSAKINQTVLDIIDGRKKPYKHNQSFFSKLWGGE